MDTAKTSCRVALGDVNEGSGDGGAGRGRAVNAPYFLFDGYAHLAAGLACGLAGLAAGMAIGIVGDAGVRCARPRTQPHEESMLPLTSCVNHGRERTAYNLCIPQPNLPLAVVLQGKRAAAEAVCGDDSHPHFCRGSRSVWPHR